VATISELNEKLYKDVLDLFKAKKICYYEINSLIEEYVSNCLICIQNIRSIYIIALLILLILIDLIWDMNLT